jgi:hypothetical protein
MERRDSRSLEDGGDFGAQNGSRPIVILATDDGPAQGAFAGRTSISRDAWPTRCERSHSEGGRHALGGPTVRGHDLLDYAVIHPGHSVVAGQSILSRFRMALQ